MTYRFIKEFNEFLVNYLEEIMILSGYIKERE
jgi:hypothetical protein